jgi:predicted dehydrogenase
MVNETITLGVIGCGYWGPNLVRNFSEIPEVRVKTLCDLNFELLDKLRSRYPESQFTMNSQDIFQDNEIDAVVIATPTSSHFELAFNALKAGKHVLVEKPLTSTSLDALILIEEAEKRNLILLVDHTYIYTAAVRKMRELVQDKVLGEIYYYDSTRINLGLFQHDVNVLWDLVVHDLSIMDYVLKSIPCGVSVTGMSHIHNNPENIAYMTLFFENNLIAHFHVNWLAPVKVRKTLIGGSQKMIVFDDLEPSEKLKIYDKGIMLNDNLESRIEKLIGYRTGDMWAPQLDRTEALFVEALHFVNCIKQLEKPITDGHAGLRVVRILEAASKSLKLRGQFIDIL